MEYVTISDLEDRVVKLGWSRGERYNDEVAKDWDPWWNFHIIVKKPGIDCDYVSESMTERELRELLELIQNSNNFGVGQKERSEFMEPDYTFVLSKHHGVLNINMKYTDCLSIWLEREQLDRIAEYIKKVLKEF